MKPTFLHHDRSILTVMLQCTTPETAIRRMRNALCHGAEGFGLQVETLYEQYQNAQTYQKIFAQASGRPIYVTNYRSRENSGKSDDQLADGLLTLADCGATLCDVMGDLYCKSEDELTYDSTAIDKQIRLIQALHQKGAEVLMSCHTHRKMSGEEILRFALEQRRRGADIVKIVAKAQTVSDELEYLKITDMLHNELDCPFLFLIGGECSIHRRLSGKLGNCMTLCVYEHDALSTVAQPLLSVAKAVRDDMGF